MTTPEGKPQWFQNIGIAGYIWVWLGTVILFFAPVPSRSIPVGLAVMAALVFAGLSVLAGHYSRPRLDRMFRWAVAFSGVIALVLTVKDRFF